MDAVIDQQTYLPRTKSFLSSLLSDLYEWSSQHVFGISIFAVMAGINSHYSSFMLETNSVETLNFLPLFVSDISVALGLVLSVLGIVSKYDELRKKYRKWRKKLNK